MGINYREAVKRGISAEKGISPPTVVLQRNQILFAADNHRDAYSPESPPEFLEHVWQLSAVSQSMIERSSLSGNAEVIKSAQDYVYTHDIGRSKEFGRRHPLIGARMLQELKMPENLIRFAVAHHRWGMGVSNMGGESFARYTIDYLDGKRDGLDPAELLEEQFGPGGIIVVIADNSKTYLDKENPHLSSIAEFNSELGDSLLLRQNGISLKIDGPNHVVERHGPRFLLHLINYMKSKYNLDYEAAVKEAQQNWPEKRTELIGMWKEIAYPEI